MMAQRDDELDAHASDPDVRQALEDIKAPKGACPLRKLGRLKPFFEAVFHQMMKHPWWSALVAASGVAACPLCKYFAAMIFAGGMIVAFRKDSATAHSDHFNDPA